jgi:hypothetical protein
MQLQPKERLVDGSRLHLNYPPFGCGRRLASEEQIRRRHLSHNPTKHRVR